uniref:MAP6 domain containing 1 n=1 Tax=Oryzias latipes TaxID=8090 RepID=A0A3P9MD63_ORYLA
MAWPCISRVCCLARFWNQFDKSDLSVPLTIQNYSDIGEQERPPPNDFRARGAPRSPVDVPFPSTTQYKQDFKPWPIPKKENFPWVSNGGSRADSGSDILFGSLTAGCTFPHRQEYRPWPGVKPAESAKRNPPTQYYSPGTEPIPRETSYQAAYSGESTRSVAVHPGESGFAFSAQPHPATQHTAPHVCSSQSPPSLQPKRTESSGPGKAEVERRSDST